MNAYRLRITDIDGHAEEFSACSHAEIFRELTAALDRLPDLYRLDVWAWAGWWWVGLWRRIPSSRTLFQQSRWMWECVEQTIAQGRCMSGFIDAVVCELAEPPKKPHFNVIDGGLAP